MAAKPTWLPLATAHFTQHFCPTLSNSLIYTHTHTSQCRTEEPSPELLVSTTDSDPTSQNLHKVLSRTAA